MVAYLLRMVKTPLNIYEHHLTSGHIKPDSQQRQAIIKLDAIYQQLSTLKKSWVKRLLSKSKPRGLYMWGSVGIGKTYLMDLFFECGEYQKLRMHFFSFMRDIHQKLRQHQGQKDPLFAIAKELAQRYDVICFDEFFVSNITDAMILGELFKYLFAEGIVLIATSNIDPDNLYKDGLQRERFLPAIEAIKQHTEVIHLTTEQDYRKQHTKPAAVYFFPLNENAEQSMKNCFEFYNNSNTFSTSALTVNQHQLPTRRHHHGILWCDFSELCVEDRSQDDYLYLAKQFHTILIDHVTTIKTTDRRTILRFIHLIDILYDQHVRVIIAAATAVADLYPQGPYEFEFQRTISRLIEMQSENYFDRDDAIIQ